MLSLRTSMPLIRPSRKPSARPDADGEQRVLRRHRDLGDDDADQRHHAADARDRHSRRSASAEVPSTAIRIEVELTPMTTKFSSLKNDAFRSENRTTSADARPAPGRCGPTPRPARLVPGSKDAVQLRPTSASPAAPSERYPWSCRSPPLTANRPVPARAETGRRSARKSGATLPRTTRGSSRTGRACRSRCCRTS